jgi:hypothetical protein
MLLLRAILQITSQVYLFCCIPWTAILFGAVEPTAMNPSLVRMPVAQRGGDFLEPTG